jgi:FKBP-type peptidyl-prolyl cis-trans isomerase
MAKYIVSIVLIIIIAVGGYLVYQNFMGSAINPTDAQNATTDTVQAQDVTVGTGAQAAPGAIVSVLYVGRLSDGTVFDSSEAHGNQPLVFQLGTPGIIPGFQIGVNGMLEGGERRMSIPPSLGYGAEDVRDPAGNVVVPANSTLVFDVRLVKVEAASATSTPTTQ